MKKRILQIVLGVIAIAAALLGTNYWQKNYLAGVATVKVPVPKSDIAPYTLLSAEMFEAQEYPRALTNQGGYILSAAGLDGKISAQALLAGLPVPERLAVPPVEFRLADPNLEVISIPAEAVSGVGGQIQVGEMINLYTLQQPPKQDEEDSAPAPKPEVVFVASVPVVAVLSDNGQPLSSGSENSQPQPMKMLVVAASHETIQRLLEAIALTKLDGGLLWITLATP